MEPQKSSHALCTFNSVIIRAHFAVQALIGIKGTLASHGAAIVLRLQPLQLPPSLRRLHNQITRRVQLMMTRQHASSELGV
eukprot:5511390-Amphidinium_carterae.1